MKPLNLVGQCFGKLQVFSQAESDDQGTRWNCLCDCGQKTTVSGKMLVAANTKSCGCWRHTPQGPDLTGKTFGRLTVLSRAETKEKRAYWLCVCQCGNSFTARAKSLRRGDTKSCGCTLKEWQAQAASIAVNKPDGEASAHQILLNYQRQAKLRNLPFELTEERFRELTKGNCYYCGVGPSQVHLHTNRRKTDTGYLYNGVDRKDNTKGYTIENCVSCCGTHNFMKKKMTAENFIAACIAVAKHFGSLP